MSTPELDAAIDALDEGVRAAGLGALEAPKDVQAAAEAFLGRVKRHRAPAVATAIRPFAD